EVRRLCDDAALGVELALREAEFHDDRLVKALLVSELRRSVSRTFTAAGYPGPQGHGFGCGHAHGRGHGHRHHEGHGGGQRWPQDLYGYTSPHGPVGPPPDGARPIERQGGSCCNCNCETP